jgi:acetyl-CoA carboxylase carboxyltransferase component
VLHRRTIAAADEPGVERDRLASEYAEEHLDASLAVQEGFVDELVAPEATRGRLAWALSTLSSERRHRERVSNIPL